MKHPGSNFLHERNPKLHASREVEGVADYLRAGGEKLPNEPAAKINAYLGFLANEDYVNDGILTGDQASIDRQIDHNVIKAEDVPENYFRLQARILHEQGHGEVDDILRQITPEVRDQMVEAAQQDQQGGLAKWVEYLGGEDGSYPVWFKHYVFGAVTKLGGYDKEKGEFLKRGKGTTAPYPELNREALAYVYDNLNKSRIKGEKVDGGANDEQLQKLLRSANFGKLYAHAVVELAPVSPEARQQTAGSWTKFDQTKDPRTARRLASSLQGHGTGWCTAGESTAQAQLGQGDFYVYYSRDEDGKDSVPRVAVRMQQGSVAEVRGINTAQELEPAMADITSQRLLDLPGGQAYIKKAEDMKRLTAIERQINDDPNATLSDGALRFLYELDQDIQGFGYDRDPRIDAIRAKRGNRDYPLLRPVIRERLLEQLAPAYEAYSAVANQLDEGGNWFKRSNPNLLSRGDVEKTVAAKMSEWEANGTFDELTERLVKYGQRFTLVATPKRLANADEIMALAKNFGKKQPAETYIYEDIYRQYGPKELSGMTARDQGGLRLSLIPSKADPDLGIKPAAEQRALLETRRAQKPHLALHVPSVLEAITYWYALRAGGDQLADSNAFTKTYIRHFDMAAKELAGWPRLPNSFVNVDGRPYLSSSRADDDREARVAVG